MHVVHKWGRWEQLVKSRYPGDRSRYVYEVQQRSCATCGKTKEKKLL